MTTVADSNPYKLPPALLAEVEAAANEEHQPVGEVLRHVIELGLGQRRLRGEILARVDAAETSLARGEGTVITQASMQQLAADVKQRGRARLAAENAPPR